MKHTITLLTALVLAAGLVGSVIAQTPKTNINTNVSLNEFIHPPVNFKPGPEYGSEARKYQGIPGIERAPGGRLWAVWYAGKIWEDQYNYVVAVTSGDDGKTWSDLKFVIDPDGDGSMRVSDPCFWLDPQGRLWLFWWLNAYGDELNTVTMAMTTDNPDAESPQWSAPRVICKGVMLNKPIVTRAGEWLLPTAIWFTDGSCRAMVSVDKGKTWSLRGTANVQKNQRNADEPMIVERRDGSLLQLVRTVFGIAQSVSKDGGRTWTESMDYLPNATSRFYLRSLASGNFLLIKHGPLDKKIGRSHLTAYLSDNEGKTWKGGLVLDERDNVSYPDGTQSPDGTIRVIYDWNRARDKHILMAVFTEADVLAGKFVSAAARSRVLINQANGINPAMYPNGKPKPKPGINDDGVALLNGSAAELECAAIETGVLKPGAKVFLNKVCEVEEVPEALCGFKFIRANLDAVRAECKQAGVVYVATPTMGENNSRAKVLLQKGFQKTNLPEFSLFGSDLISIYQKQVVANEVLDLGKWVVLILPQKD